MGRCPTQAVLPLVGLAAEKVIRDRYIYRTRPKTTRMRRATCGTNDQNGVPYGRSRMVSRLPSSGITSSNSVACTRALAYLPSAAFPRPSRTAWLSLTRKVT
ncbi:MAG: hypothetical protein R6U98_05605 [Pirellulaceae bacterium]